MTAFQTGTSDHGSDAGPDAPSRRASALDPKEGSTCVVMPVRNEAANIRDALRSVMNQTFDPRRTEIVVVDGMSNDGTRDVVAEIARADNRIRLIDNPARLTAAGLNKGIASTRSNVVARVDGHCRLAPDYLDRCMELLATSRAGSVGGLMRPQGKGLVGQAAAIALSSRFGIGDSRFHYLNRQEYVDSVYLGAFRREVLDEVGYFDETLLANEDFELNHRIRQAGYGVLLSPAICSTYMPRESLASICRQFYGYGRGKAKVMIMHPDSIQPRHLAAPLLVASLVSGFLGFTITRKSRFLLPAFLYGCLVTAAAVITGKPRRFMPILMAVYSAMHLSWGWGVISGLANPSALGSRERVAR